jgi:hypothetical protein
VKAQGKKTKAAPTVLKKTVPTFPESFYPHTNPHKRTEFTRAAVRRERVERHWRAERDRAWRVGAKIHSV